jgi:hypothetical protein
MVERKHSKKKSPQFQSLEYLMPIGFRFDPESRGAELYAGLICGGEKDRPLTIQQRIVFCKSPALLRGLKGLKATNLSQSLQSSREFLQKERLLCDIAEALYLLESRDEDKSATIINCINTFSDFIPATGVKLPEQYQAVFIECADYLTFHRNYGDYFRERSISRSQVIDSFLWCLGCLFARAKFIF